MNVSVPLLNVHALTTLHTQVHVVDTGDPAQTITCVDIYVTPYEENSWPYRLFLWFPISLAIAYFITTWAARFAAGWVVSPTRSALDRREASMLKWGTMLISGLSGERFGVSAALLRFGESKFWVWLIDSNARPARHHASHPVCHYAGHDRHQLAFLLLSHRSPMRMG